MRRLVSPLMFIALCAPHGASAGDKEAPPEKSGLKVGEKAPSFKLKDQTGKERTLEEFLKTGKVALVFTRSAQW